MSDVTDLSLVELRDSLRAKTLSSSEVTASYLARIEGARGLNAFILETPDKAHAMAKAADERLRRGGGGRLEGVPLGVKDLFATDGTRTTAGSRILSERASC